MGTLVPGSLSSSDFSLPWSLGRSIVTGTITFDAADLSTVLRVDNVSAATATLTLSNTSFSRATRPPSP